MNNHESMKVIETDVLVAGGGPAGLGAAIAAGRNGAKVIMVEKAENLGGMYTGGLVMGFHGMRVHRNRHTVNVYQYNNYYETQAIRGVPQQLMDRLVEQGGVWGEKGRSTSCVLSDPEIVKVVAEEACREAGVDIWFQSLVTRPVIEQGKITGVVVENKSGAHLIKAKMVVDATGDADVAARSGVSFELGGPNGELQPVTLTFIMGGVDLGKSIAYLKQNPEELHSGDIKIWEELYQENKPLNLNGFYKLISKAFQQGDYPMAMGAKNPIPIFVISSVFRWGQIVPDQTFQIVDMAYNVDTTNGKQVSAALANTRKQALLLAGFMRKYIPGYENAYLLQTAPQLGIRESRRIIGEYQLTGDDVVNGRDFEDGIARCGRAMNVHSSDGGKVGEPQGGRKWTEIKDAKTYAIPYRCLLPKSGPDNLLVAGRAIAVDRDALGSVRGQPTCMATGEAAGTAAALAVQSGASARTLDRGRLREQLVKQDVII